ncbi:hypothetical protein [Bacillus thuringiensis]|nr:hypothetical protein [Bacillus thuringiensis]MEC3146752.1 hypothetical protein [Bacillus thuringiensis]
MISPQEGNISLIVGPMFAGKTEFFSKVINTKPECKKTNNWL